MLRLSELGLGFGGGWIWVRDWSSVVLGWAAVGNGRGYGLRNRRLILQEQPRVNLLGYLSVFLGQFTGSFLKL